ncbi:MAG: aldo/keto reductase family oxidoreductase [Spirochaetia bacterium]|nr:aldo/keto reductase family oxidoreductase [Spirochaetia bacterium]
MKIRTYEREVPKIILGCMRIASKEDKEVDQLITTAIDNGVNFFDHADIYGRGESETKFAKSVKALNLDRDKLIIQSKASIRPGICYDFSKDHILKAIDGSLKRLNTDYLDFFLFHRPDPLMDVNEVSDIINSLIETKKVKSFGVSNQNTHQMNLLNKYCDNKLAVNQLQMSITNCPMIDSSINVNMDNSYSIDRDAGMLEYSILNDITIQAWSPFQYGFFEGVFINNAKFKELNIVLDKLSQKYNVEKEAVVAAWLLRIPNKIQVIAGTTNYKRLNSIIKAKDILLTREEWYELYISAGKKLP